VHFSKYYPERVFAEILLLAKGSQLELKELKTI